MSPSPAPNTHHPKEDPMQQQTLSQKLDQKSAQVILKAIGSFPQFLARSEPEAAAKIVADLIKTLMARPVEEEDPGDELARVVEECRARVEARESKP